MESDRQIGPTHDRCMIIEGTVWGTFFRYKRFFVEETGCLAKSLIMLLTPKRWQPASLGFVNPLRILCLGKHIMIIILDAPNLTLRGKVEKWDTSYSKLGARINYMDSE